ncbi:MAG: 1-acyl-sn-glycerol-3-phosphate acyltransferase [Clostridiales bacterium]|nr:1-acyl-sn-glycerol-3-phosphate acyltransferase [Clostridiales bacterium]
MNTKAYREMFKMLLDAGELPQDIYDKVISEIDADGKMTVRVYNMYLEELERRRLFAVDGAPFTTKNSARTDGTYVYKRPKNPFWHIHRAIWATIGKIVGFLASGIGYGFWHFPRKEKKKLKGVGACITVSNHVGYLDGGLTRRALGMKKQYIIVAPHNCKRNLGGAILKSAIAVPLPISFHGVKPFNEMLEYLKDKGAALHFYAEKSMWIRYRKPRPYQDGAFFYADKLDVPIVPMLYCFKESRGLRKLFGMPRAVIRVADPIYPNAELSHAERRKDLRERTEEATKKLYEEFYGIELEYLPPLEVTDAQTDGEQTLEKV